MMPTGYQPGQSPLPQQSRQQPEYNQQHQPQQRRVPQPIQVDYDDDDDNYSQLDFMN